MRNLLHWSSVQVLLLYTSHYTTTCQYTRSYYTQSSFTCTWLTFPSRYRSGGRMVLVLSCWGQIHTFCMHNRTHHTSSWGGDLGRISLIVHHNTPSILLQYIATLSNCEEFQKCFLGEGRTCLGIHYFILTTPAGRLQIDILSTLLIL